MTLVLSCAFPPVPATPDHVALAESLGFARAWVYDTPALQLDCWMTLALAASRTDRIVLGPGVLIPSLRHPMVTAAAIAHLVDLAGTDRVVVGMGTGFTGRRAMGQKPMRWTELEAMLLTIRALLRGETVEIDRRSARMLHWDGQAPQRPIEVPFVLGVNGPKGIETARRNGCGVFTSRPRVDAAYHGIEGVTLLGMGTVLGPGESLTTPRVLETAGPGASVAYHAFLEQRDPRLSTLPNAAMFVELADALPAGERHLHVHEGHLTQLNALDRKFLEPEALAVTPLTCPAEDLAGRLKALEQQGITEVAFQPMGDIETELRRFATAGGLTS